jgi:hypothetical protein
MVDAVTPPNELYGDATAFERTVISLRDECLIQLFD